MADFAGLKQAIQDAFKGIKSDFPIPTFTGKLNEKPETHCLKCEDWFEHTNTTDDKEKAKLFKATLKGKPRTWYAELPPEDSEKYDDEAGPPVVPRLKSLFCERWSCKGKTKDALYAEWQALSFKPSEDDIEEFITDVEHIAKRLSYPEPAIIMAIKNALPMEAFYAAHAIDNLKDLRTFCIKYFDNPRIKKQYTAQAGNPITSALSAISTPAPKSPRPQSSDIGKLTSKLSNIESSLNSLRTQGPYKPRVSNSRGNFQRGRQPFFRPSRGRDNYRQRSNYNQQYRRYSPRPQRRWHNNQGRNNNGYNNAQKFHNSPNTKRPRIAGKPFDKDKMRCFNCNEIGHYAKDCRKVQKKVRFNPRLHSLSEHQTQEDVELAHYEVQQDNSLNHFYENPIEDPLAELTHNMSSLNI